MFNRCLIAICILTICSHTYLFSQSDYFKQLDDSSGFDQFILNKRFRFDKSDNNFKKIKFYRKSWCDYHGIIKGGKGNWFLSTSLNSFDDISAQIKVDSVLFKLDIFGCLIQAKLILKFELIHRFKAVSEILERRLGEPLYDVDRMDGWKYPRLWVGDNIMIRYWIHTGYDDDHRCYCKSLIISLAKPYSKRELKWIKSNQYIAIEQPEPNE